MPVLISTGLAEGRDEETDAFSWQVAKREKYFPDNTDLCKIAGLLGQVNVYLFTSLTY